LLIQRVRRLASRTNPRCGAGWACKEQGKYKRSARPVRVGAPARIAEVVLSDEHAAIPIGSHDPVFGGTLSLSSRHDGDRN
jgi:hypothetical protein